MIGNSGIANSNPKAGFGELLTAQLHPQFQGSFEYTVSNTDLNTNTVVNGGTVDQDDGMAVVSSSTTTASTALFQSKQHAKYKPGLGGLSRFTALFSAPIAATEQYIGIMDEPGSDAASGSVQLTGGASGSVDGITVNSIEIMSGAESFDTDLTTTAQNIVDNINANTSAPNYSATSLGVLITITSDIRGTAPNTFVVTSSTTTITTTDTDLSGGTDGAAAFKNGYAVGYDGLTFGFHRFQNDALITVAQADWDDPMDGTGRSGMTIDQTKLNVFEIRYQYLGSGKIELCVENDKTGLFIVVHAIQYTNTSIEPSTHNPNYFHTMWVDNIGTASDIILKSASYGYFVEGKTDLIEIHQPENSTGTKTETSVTTEVAIFTIRNKKTYASKPNFIDILMLSIGGSLDNANATNQGTLRFVKNAVLGGSPSYDDINTTNSVIEIDTAGTTVTGGKELGASEFSGKSDRDRAKLREDKIILNPGDTITVAGTSDNSATIKANGAWRELF